jgi:hypothetical protein
MYFGVIVPVRHSTTVPSSGNAKEIDLPHTKGKTLLYQGNGTRTGNFITSSERNLVTNTGN